VYVIADTSCGPGDAERFGEILLRFARASRSEPGCLDYGVFRSVEQPERYLSVEKYADSPAFEAHRDSPHFRDIGMAELLPLATARDVRVFTDPKTVPPRS
jgi:quinol monooxygenase YgiN